MANKYHYDVKNCYYAVATKGAGGVLTYETPVAIPGLVSMDMGAEGDQLKIRADGIDYLVLNSNNGYSGTLNFVQIPDSFKAAVLGEVADTTTGIQYENAASIGAIAIPVRSIPTFDNPVNAPDKIKFPIVLYNT